MSKRETTRSAKGIPPPSADRTQLQQIIAGLTEGVILVDPDQTIAWANATALALHGASDISELGKTVSEYRRRFVLTHRNDHALPDGDSPIERLMSGEAFSETTVEVTRKDDGRWWVHRIRTLVLTDPAGTPDCLVLIINDDTERFNAEQRFERAFGANPAPAVIARLSDLRYIKVNKGFLELTGFDSDGLLGRSMHEFDVLRHAERRDLALKRLNSGETIPQMEGCLDLPDGEERTILLGGQPIEMGDEKCMLFTFADLHPRQLAQKALRHSEERFSKAFHMAPGPMAMLELDDLRIIDVNGAFTAATGWGREEAIGREYSELGLWADSDAKEQLKRRLQGAEHPRGVEVKLRGKDGAEGEFLLSAETVEIHGKPCVLCLMVDIGERKQTETDLLAAVESVMRDTSWLSQRIVERMAAFSKSGRPMGKVPEVSGLSERAREVLALMAQGLADQEIANKLAISRNTVKNHVSAIYTKLGIRKRSAVIVWARERGLGGDINVRTTLGKTAKRKRT